LLEVLAEEGIGSIAFSPLEQGLLTDKYLMDIPKDSRAAREESPFLNREDITEDKLAKVQKLNQLAKKRGQSLAQMAIVWLLRQKAVTSVLVGASKVSQIEDDVAALNTPDFTDEELQRIEKVLNP